MTERRSARTGSAGEASAEGGAEAACDHDLEPGIPRGSDERDLASQPGEPSSTRPAGVDAGRDASGAGEQAVRERAGGGSTTNDTSADEAECPGEDRHKVEEARRLFSGRVEFLLSAPALEYLPEPGVPEVAFCGRSNVGKSSLINAITGRKAIARTSVTPGRTQELNFFEIGEPTRFRLVDMPGYGFAKAPLKVVERWRSLVRNYLRGRAVLRRTLLLIDSRHGLKPSDIEMMKMLDEAAVGYRIVLTKADKVNADSLRRVLESTGAAARRHSAAYPRVRVTSAEKGMGISVLRAEILADTQY